ncbi:MAG: hypothetical protein HQM03_14545 [Magnetococcales bacterium]|nr:hypothetical protein [Magnetococcales bacterium]
MKSDPLTRIVARGGETGQRVPLHALWPGGTDPAPPSSRMAVLAIHGAKPSLSWVDRMGFRIQAGWRRLNRPMSALKVIAVAVLRQAEPHRKLSEGDLAVLLATLAQNCRVAGAGTPGRIAPTEMAALAGVAVAVERIHGFTPHVEQIMGALGLLGGDMVEMATGEGKTLTAAMAAIVAAWRGLPCHVVTANDYLARRDVEIGQPLFALCRVSAASVFGEMPPDSRAAAHGHDIVYGTAKELLGDYLRDGLALGKNPSRAAFALSAARQGGGGGREGVVMRGIFQVIVDEADSVLIDEAVTPLIISSQHPDTWLDQAARDAVQLAGALRAGQEYTLHRALRNVSLTGEGEVRVEELARALSPFWRHRDRARELVEMALYAREFMIRDQHFVVDDDKIVLVDELTGRLARQHTLSLGMQQILEAGQGLPISPPTEVSARLSFQRFFQLFQRIGGMTGTAEEARGEFAKVYRLTTVRIPTHRPVRRVMWPMVVLFDGEEKHTAISRAALEVAAAGRAVLIGMKSVRSSEAVYRRLRELDPHVAANILHAVHHAQESAIVAKAGQPGAITIATNMAGRGTDIALHKEVRDKGGLHVIIGETNDFSRIDRQLIGRCARQGDPGTVQRFVACDEELARRFLPGWVVGMWIWQHQWLSWLDGWCGRLVLHVAQRRAERMAWRQRQATLKMDIELDRSGF